MTLEFLEIDLLWPHSVPLEDLRSMVLSHLDNYGTPLRWAITEICDEMSNEMSRQLRIEAVVIKNA